MHHFVGAALATFNIASVILPRVPREYSPERRKDCRRGSRAHRVVEPRHPLAARGRRYRLDRQLVLLHPSRPQPQAAVRFPNGDPGRRLAGAWRRLLSHGEISGGAEPHAGRADLVQVGGLHHLALGLCTAGPRLLHQCRALPDRQVGARFDPDGSRRRRVRKPAGSVAALRGAVPVAARSPRGCACPAGLRPSRRPHLCLHPCVQRTRCIHPDRGSDRHHHGGQRLRHRHSEPEKDGGCDDRGQGAQPGVGRRGQAALGAQQLPHPAGHLPDDRQSLSAHVRDPVQLADRRDRIGDRAGHPPLFQFPPRGQREPMVDVGRRRRRNGRGCMAVGRGAARHGGRRPSRSGRRCGGAQRHSDPLQHVSCGRTGVAGGARAAQRRGAGRSREHSPPRPSDRHQLGALERDASRQYHRDDARKSAGFSPPGSPPARRRSERPR